MEKRLLGSLEVSLAGLGCNNFGWRINAQETENVVRAAIDSGINFFDTADIYGSGQSEEFLGKALGPRRSQVIVATKFGLPMDDKRKGAKPAYVKQALEDSLRRLNTHYIDLYQLHKPDPTTPIADTIGALEEAKRAGKVREIGCSNFTAEQIREAKKFASVQNEFSLLHRDPEAEVLPECERSHVAFLPYFPLANGLLSGKYRKGQPFPKGARGADGWGPKVFTDENLAKVEALIHFAESQGHTLLQLAMSWLACRPAVVSVIAGAKTVDQIRMNSTAVNWKLSSEQLAKVDRLMS
jgi:aryl-alcohol dehydrogenase-like predicted oxidoreductase